MTKTSKAVGIMGLLGAALLLVGVAAAAASFERGAYSPASCFVTELGQYPRGYFSVSSALYFNIGMAAFGLAFGLVMIVRGGQGETALQGAAGFMGALTGVLAIAQAIFTLNFPQYHFIVATAFYLSAFVFCVLQIAVGLGGAEKRRFGLALLMLAFFAAALCLAAGAFLLTGGMADVFREDAQGAARLLFMPFAAVGWLALAAVWALGALLSLDMALSPARSAAAQSAPAEKKKIRRNDFAL